MLISFEEFKRQVVNDYKLAGLGREMRLAANKERSIGGITAGSDVAQVALSKQFAETDWHTSAGIDLTFEVASGTISPIDFFKRLYSSDYDMRLTASTGHLPQAAGLAMASKIYRNNPEMADNSFASDSDSVTFCTIGSRFVTDGNFLETVYSAAAQQIPLVVVLWNNTGEYSNGNLMKQISGFANLKKNSQAITLQSVKGYDYPALCRTFEGVALQCRQQHVPVVVCVDGSNDDLAQMRSWIIDSGIATEPQMVDIDRACRQAVNQAQKDAYYKSLIDEKVAPIRTHADSRCEGLSQLLLNTHKQALVLDEAPGIINKAIGMAMRGLRPVVTIESANDIVGSQLWQRPQAPIIVRTSSTSIGMLVNSLPNTVVAVPSDMRQAASLYVWLLQNNRSAVVAEPFCNKCDIRSFAIEPCAPGGSSVVSEGTNVTVVCFGRGVETTLDAAKMLREKGISIEVVALETIIPLDVKHAVGESVRKTRRLAVVDIDSTGGTAAYILTKCFAKQSIFKSLDNEPIVISAKQMGDIPLAVDISTAIYTAFCR